MPTSPATSGDRLLHCSPARTVFACIDPMQAGGVVAKVYLAGAMADAEREFAMGKLAAGAGVVEHLAVRLDASTNRPCVVTQLEAGQDLDRWVSQRGALPAAAACALLAPVAATLARLHAARGPGSPNGICHGDIKPRNLLRSTSTTLLLDFEHAWPIGARASGSFGTPGFTAPEAERGIATAALDVFALGRTLAWLLGGGHGGHVPVDRRLAELLAACTHPTAEHRPTAASLATTLRTLAGELAPDPAEAALTDWATATFALRPDAGDADPRVVQWHRRQRLLARVPTLLHVPTAVPTEPGPLRAALARAVRTLRRFPRHPGLLQWRRDLQDGIARLLADAARFVTAQCKAEAFLPAAAWLVVAEITARDAMALPGGLPLPADAASSSATLLHRDPLTFLQRLGGQIAAARSERNEQVDRVEAAMRDLDLPGAEKALEAMATQHGGASPSVARQRDRLHRLGFYLDRIGRAATNVERLLPLQDTADLQPLGAFVAAAGRVRSRAATNDGSGGAVGLRNLQLTLTSLVEEFPMVTSARPALDALARALVHVSDRAHELLADARQRLQSIPVPVRPLQLTLSRLDSCRILEALVDRPERPRSHLLDGIESLRLALEQARATRDRLAESAENALARGHWTTGLFEMERAVAGLGPDAHEQEEAQVLQARLADARKRKQEVEATARRNIDLATLYGTLQDDPSSTFEQRLQVLEERRDCLLFLGLHVPAERGALYHGDLRSVETQIALERAGLAEHRLDGTLDLQARLQLARATLESLTAETAPSDRPADAPGRLVRLVEHWRTLTAQCQRAIDQAWSEQALRARQKRRLLAVLLIAVLVTGTAVAWAMSPWFPGKPAMAGSNATPRGH